MNTRIIQYSNNRGDEIADPLANDATFERMISDITISAGFDSNINSVEGVLKTVKYLKSAGYSPRDLANIYFSRARRVGASYKMGVIETPKKIANFIVTEAIETYTNACKLELQRPDIVDIKWYDSSVGAAVFVCSILELYEFIYKRFPRTAAELPYIRASDMSPFAAVVTGYIIQERLNAYRISLADYFESGRLTLTIGDSLCFNSEIGILNDKNRFIVDVVVGNPPYVRSTRMSHSYKHGLRSAYPSVSGNGSDLSSYFIANGLISLKEHGVLAFITPASFFRAKNGEKLRHFISKNAVVRSVYDLDELKIFAGADVHSAIFILEKQSRPSNTEHIKYAHVSTEMELSKLLSQSSSVTLRSKPVEISKRGWIIDGDTSVNRLLRTTKDSKTLTECGYKVYSGIRTGCYPAFVYPKIKLNSIDPKLRLEWFRDVVRARDINKWNNDVSSLQLLFAHSECPEPPPYILSLLSIYRDRLRFRPEAKLESSWYKLRTCSYYNIMESRKIIFPDITATPRFALDTTGSLVLDGAFFIDTDDLALLGILNSGSAWRYLSKYCSSIGNVNSNGRVRLKKCFIEKFPLPDSFLDNVASRNRVIAVVREIIDSGENKDRIQQLNNAVDEFYAGSL